MKCRVGAHAQVIYYDAHAADGSYVHQDALLPRNKVSGWRVYCYAFRILPITSYCFQLLLVSPARVWTLHTHSAT